MAVMACKLKGPILVSHAVISKSQQVSGYQFTTAVPPIYAILIYKNLAVWKGARQLQLTQGPSRQQAQSSSKEPIPVTWTNCPQSVTPERA